MWAGRKKECAQLENFIRGEKEKAALLYGKRRIGKTSLVKKVLGDTGIGCLFFEALEGNYSTNLDLFTSMLSERLSMPLGTYKSFIEVFSLLKMKKESLVIVIDEYQYIKQAKVKNEVDSEFKQVIDNLPDNIKLILTGSHASIMKELMLEENPLFGRFHLIINLCELDYLESREFYSHCSATDAIRINSVFGGSPYILSFYDTALSIEENIKRLLINPTSIGRTYIEFILFKEAGKKGVLNDILRLLGNSKMRYSELEAGLNMKSSGLLAYYLDLLQDMSLIEKTVPINSKNERKKRFYSISDNLVRFYYAYIHPNKSTIENIGADLFYDSYIKPSLDTFISYRFEAMVRSCLKRTLSTKRDTNVLDIGTYWYDDAKNHGNGEFDCVVKFRDHYSVYEVKFRSKPMSLEEIEEEAEKIRRVKEFSCVNICFVCSSGFERQPEGYEYLTAEDIYK